jgi:5-formyltetrahydrofolate cyclo-ligase
MSVSDAIQPADVSASTLQSDKRELRRLLRARRHQLTRCQQNTAAIATTLRLLRSEWFRHSDNLAFYLANDGEIETSLLMHVALDLGKHCYLPRIDRSSRPLMQFARYRRGDRLLRNRFGIAEPLPRATLIAADELDLVLMPLVGFDTCGGRLGMGAGYYDRSFSGKRLRPKTGPRLIGLAHDCQRVDLLPINAWDVPLNGVVTDTATYRFR